MVVLPVRSQELDKEIPTWEDIHWDGHHDGGGPDHLSY